MAKNEPFKKNLSTFFFGGVPPAKTLTSNLSKPSKVSQIIFCYKLYQKTITKSIISICAKV